jgi:fumarate hydratase class II
MASMRKETDSLGIVEVAADKLWGAQTQRSLEHFSIGTDLIPREMITAYATLKKAAAIANHAGKRLDDERYKLIVQTCDEILGGQHHDMFPLHVWMTGSGTQFNMNVNEVISNRCCVNSRAHLWEAMRRSILTITSTWRSRRTTHFRRRCISPQPST